MSTPYETEVTLTIADVEQDVTVRAHVEYGPGFGGAWGGTVRKCTGETVAKRVARELRAEGWKVRIKEII